jgi:SAM-dependent methyltransferase
MDWQHGYRAEVTYTCGFFRELTPDWLDLAALLKVQPSPRPKPGAPFRYLELGSGMGFHLCLQAALYPEGEFIGIDFNPDHIVHSQRLSEALQLDNVRFAEADILSLASQPGDLAHGQHYVVAHGVATWVKEPIRQALMQLAATALRPGGLFYCSYNTLPGWLDSFPLRQLARAKAMQRGTSPDTSLQCLLEATETLKSFVANPINNGPLGMNLPGLRHELGKIENHDPEYLIQEYMNEFWEPLDVHTMHTLAASHKLRYVSSATLVENFEWLLHDSVRPIVLSETDPTIRQTLLDIATYKRFRRDIFCRGSFNLTSTELSQQFRQLRVALKETPQRQESGFLTSFGVINFKADACAAIEDLLAPGPLDLGSLQDRLSLEKLDLAQVIVLLLEADRIGLHRGDASLQAEDRGREANRYLTSMQLAGRPYAYRAVASLGTAVRLVLGEALAEAALQNDPEADPIPAIIAGMDQLNVSNKGDVANGLQAYKERRPGLQRLGVIEP